MNYYHIKFHQVDPASNMKNFFSLQKWFTEHEREHEHDFQKDYLIRDSNNIVSILYAFANEKGLEQFKKDFDYLIQEIIQGDIKESYLFTTN